MDLYSPNILKHNMSVPKFDVNKALNKINEYTDFKNDNDEGQQWKDKVLKCERELKKKLDRK